MIAPSLLDPVSGGSFYRDPFLFYDQTLTYTGTTSLRKTLEFHVGGGAPPNFRARIWTQLDGGSSATGPLGQGGVEGVDDQFYVDGDGGNDWSVRRVSDDGPDTVTEPGGTMGDWYNSGTHRKWLLPKPAVNLTTVENTSTYELAYTADTTTILARATVKLIYNRVD